MLETRFSPPPLSNICADCSSRGLHVAGTQRQNTNIKDIYLVSKLSFVFPLLHIPWVLKFSMTSLDVDYRA